MKKSSITQLGIILALTGFLAGCSTVTLKSGAENIKVIKSPAPKSCQFLGQIANSDVNGATQSYTSHEHLQIDELTNLKNQALALGANTIVIAEHQTTYITRHDNSKRVDTHGLIGEAYRCKAETLNRLKAQTITDISDAANTQ